MMKKLNKTIRCADGFSMSVQASSTSYCEPRVDNAEKYTAVEIGFPSQKEPLLMDWAEYPDRPTETIYGWVPTDRVSLIIAKHGGVTEGQLPPGIPFLRAKA